MNSNATPIQPGWSGRIVGILPASVMLIAMALLSGPAVAGVFTPDAGKETITSASYVSEPAVRRATGHIPVPAHLFTPDAWKQTVTSPSAREFAGQKKHIGWNRDQDGDFIDDEIRNRFGPDDSVNVVLELNRAYSEKEIATFLAPDSVHITYVGRLVSCVYLRRVPFLRLRALARHKEVAMVEWQTPFRTITNVSIRGTGVVESGTYPDRRFARATNESGLCGSGINVAILDTGVLNDNPNLPAPMIVSGRVGAFDATTSTQMDPAPSLSFEEHGTQVAAIVLGRSNPSTAIFKRQDPNDSAELTTAGVAPQAGLVDVRVCEQNDYCDFNDSADGEVMKGIEWVAYNAEKYSIRVANFSISDAVDCDGTCTICEAVNVLASIGVVPVAGHGNADRGKKGHRDKGGGKGEGGAGSGHSGNASRKKKSEYLTDAGDRITASPAAASQAITVAGLNDKGTVTRDDDEAFTFYLVGPRNDLIPDGTELKPDIAAPAEGVVSMGISGDYFSTGSGTSFAAAHVSGAVALLLEALPQLDPQGVKARLINSADKSALGGSSWSAVFGNGFLDVGAALPAE